MEKKLFFILLAWLMILPAVAQVTEPDSVKSQVANLNSGQRKKVAVVLSGGGALGAIRLPRDAVVPGRARCRRAAAVLLKVACAVRRLEGQV